MSAGKCLWRKRLLTLTAAVLLCTPSGQAVQTMVYEKPAVYGKSVDETLGTAVLMLKGEEGMLCGWCADPGLETRQGSRYWILTPQMVGGLYERNADQIASVLQRSWPAVSLEQLQESCGINNLTLQEAISATQLAVWSLTQGYMQYMGEERVDTAVTWLLLGDRQESGKEMIVCWPLEAGLQPLVGLQ